MACESLYKRKDANRLNGIYSIVFKADVYSKYTEGIFCCYDSGWIIGYILPPSDLYNHRN